jgi:hypothetical protein
VNDQDWRPHRAPKTLEELEAQLLQSIHQLDLGKGKDGEEVIRRLRKRIKGARG